MIVEVCIGSSCFVKGSNEVVAFLKEYVAEHGLTDQIVLKGAFCMGMCTQGLGVKIDGESIKGLTLYNMKEILDRELNRRL